MSSNSPWPPPAQTPASQPEQAAQAPLPEAAAPAYAAQAPLPEPAAPAYAAAPPYPGQPPYPEPPAYAYAQPTGYQQPYAYNASVPVDPSIRPDAPARRGRGLAIVSFSASGLLVLGLLLNKLLQALLIIPTGVDDENGFVEALGYIGFASIVLILFAIVAGHIAFARSARGSATRVLALLGFSIGYLMLILYILRLLATLLNMQGSVPSDHLTVPGEFFWWS